MWLAEASSTRARGSRLQWWRCSAVRWYSFGRVRCVLERRPASSVVVEVVYPKFVRKDASATKRPKSWSRRRSSFPSNGVGRSWDARRHDRALVAGSPAAHPARGIYAGEGLPLTKSTICTWHEQLAADA